MRYEIEWLLECLLIRVKSPETYEHLRVNKILCLPSKDTLRKMRSRKSPEFGFNDFALQSIKRNLKNKSLTERYGSLMWDEMSITQDLHFDKKKLIYIPILQIVRKKIVTFLPWTILGRRKKKIPSP